MSTLNPIIEGLNVLAKYYPDARFVADGNQLFYGTYEPDRIEKGDLEKLHSLGWLEDRNSWSHFC